MHLVFFLEEASARAFLQELLPRMLPAVVTPTYVVFQGKQDLEKQLSRKLRGWQRPNSRFVVLRDRDAGDCRVIKVRLQNLAKEAGRPEALIRIACRELESWYLGDLKAVEMAFGVSGIAREQRNKKFRAPDGLGNPEQELLRMVPSYQQISGSRAMGKVMSLEGNSSHSFNAFINGLTRILESEGVTP
ncbi:MAG: DUF4276 family protein [Magnetococcales bacterium]|nr:DUF4276 family protein [Magnetococcales bacterium]MBF0424027.1 DUF4276 family protein [Magnetococcales bacterium]